MHRRGFLAAGLATALSVPRALAQMKMDGMSNMDSMPGMGGHAGHDMGAMSKGPAPLPEGEALRELSLLANDAGRPGLFRARLTAAPATARFAADRDTPILGYNGMSPGPLIEAHEGDRVEITFANRIEGEPSTIHWHGMPVPAGQDGNPMDQVAAGADRVYAFELPEGSAGSYWYHPHPHGRTAEQVYRGLAGAFVVKAKADPVPTAYGDTVLMFTDLRLAADGSMPESDMKDLMNGRVGDHVLVNGQKNPRLAMAMGAKRRLRLYNATNARFLRLAFDGAAMTIIGTDGGLLGKPVAADEILLSPAERVELVVAFDRPGAATLTALDYDRGWMGPGQPADAGLTLLTVDVSETPAEAMPPLPEQLRPIAPLGQPTVSRRFVFTETMAMNATGMEMGFLINGKAFDMERVDIVARAGETELWEIVNQADMDHPFHLHGTQFQVVERERDGKVSKQPYLAWKDTVNVARGETVRLKLRQERPGPRMYHCHILEHEQLGMMGIVDVQA
ncbi:MAG: multicopper oxidase family protein [Mesorhizobium sp.]|uniref:multicopper oxidase family protein n=1 Tax=unclassified Mesorhizobium TaxID=325217 RepID=UPI000F76391E|nr:MULTISPECIES: multicopper oxidase family protein [unclassified Mesorhizobium]AZO70518.1 multicopper oxidase family protein [Mesorhizobium sp. M1D.F.Ca.ET.043.01.1.1]RWA84307.1 MAG: multicopper oxidase family protein [Mesorhizobium sp.]TJW85760.1 MAG: multicopper oxidase family protein [Mesorhizobium sp.]